MGTIFYKGNAYGGGSADGVGGNYATKGYAVYIIG